MKKYLLMINFVFISVSFACTNQGARSSDVYAAAPTGTNSVAEQVTFTVVPSETPSPQPTITQTPVGSNQGLLLSDCWYTQDISSDTFGCQQKLLYYDLSTGISTVLLEDTAPAGSEYHLAGQSADSTNVLLKHGDHGHLDLFILDLRQLGQIDPLYEDVFDAVWLPGSDLIALLLKQGKQYQVFTMKSDGSNLTQISHSKLSALTLPDRSYRSRSYTGECARSSTNRKHHSELSSVGIL